MIELAAVGKRFAIGHREVQALQPTTLSIEGGEMVAITGPSGSGKSTLMHLLGCLDRPTEGSYRLEGARIADLDDASLADVRNRRIGFVFQAFFLMPRMTALENVMHPLEYRGMPLRARIGRARNALDRVGMEAWADHRPAQLSGGQQQRVAIARALVGEPGLLLADEPTGNLDSAAAAGVLTLLRALRDEGRTVVMVTHDAAVAASCPRRVKLRDGAVIEDWRAAPCVR